MIGLVIALILIIVAGAGAAGGYVYVQTKKKAKIAADAAEASTDAQIAHNQELEAALAASDAAAREAELQRQLQDAASAEERALLDKQLADARAEAIATAEAAEAAKLAAEIKLREAEAAAAKAALEAETKRIADEASAQKLASTSTTSVINSSNQTIASGADATRTDITETGTAQPITVQYSLSQLALVFKAYKESRDTTSKYMYVKGTIINDTTVDLQMNVKSSTGILKRVDAVRVVFYRLSDGQLRVKSVGAAGSGITVLPDLTSQFGPEQLWPKARGYYWNSGQKSSTTVDVVFVAGTAVGPTTVDFLFRLPYISGGVRRNGASQNRRFEFKRNADGSYSVLSMGAAGTGIAAVVPVDYTDITGRYPCSSDHIQGIITNYWISKNAGKTIKFIKAATFDKASCDFLMGVFEGTRQLGYENRRFKFSQSTGGVVTVSTMGVNGSGLLTPKPAVVGLNSNYTVPTGQTLWSVYASSTSRRYPKPNGYNGTISAGTWATNTLASDSTQAAKWTIESAGSGMFYVKSGPVYYMYGSDDLYARGSSKKTTNAYKWRIAKNSTGKYAIQNVQYGTYLGIDYGSVPGVTIKTYHLSIKNMNALYAWSEYKVISLLENPDATPKLATMSSSAYVLVANKDYIIKSYDKSIYVYGSKTNGGYWSVNRTALDLTKAVPAIYKWRFQPVPNQVNTYMISGGNGTYLNYNAKAVPTTTPNQDYAWEIALISGKFVFRSRKSMKYLAPSTFMTTSTSKYDFTITDVPVLAVTDVVATYALSSNKVYNATYRAYDGRIYKIHFPSGTTLASYAEPAAAGLRFIPVSGKTNTYYIRRNAPSYVGYHFYQTTGSSSVKYQKMTDNKDEGYMWIVTNTSRTAIKNKKTGLFIYASGSLYAKSTVTYWSIPTVSQTVYALDTSYYIDSAPSAVVATTAAPVVAAKYNPDNLANLIFRIHNGAGKWMYVKSDNSMGMSATQPVDAYDFKFELVYKDTAGYNGDRVRIKNIKTGRYLRGRYFPSDSFYSTAGTIASDDRNFSLTGDREQWYIKEKAYPAGFVFMNKAAGDKGYLGAGTGYNVGFGTSAYSFQLNVRAVEHFQSTARLVFT